MSKGKATDEWELHESDYPVWRRFWALAELRRKWKWANSFFLELDRVDGEVVEPEAWGIPTGISYMKLCMWIALLRSVHEGMTKGLNSHRLPAHQCVSVADVLPTVPPTIQDFPSQKLDPFPEFRNVVFHCQWTPCLEEFKLDEPTTRSLEKLHEAIGNWLEEQYRLTFEAFKKKYETPRYWFFGPDMEAMFE